jgi:hypothetical protein
MIIEKLDPHVWYFTDIIESPEECFKEIKQIESWKTRFGTKDAEGNWITNDYHGSFVDQANISGLSVFKDLKLAVEECTKAYALEHGYGFIKDSVVGPGSLLGIEMVDMHHPPTSLKTHADTRQPGRIGVTVLVYLNDDYDGGELSVTIKDSSEKSVGGFGVDEQKHPDESQDNISFWIKPKQMSVVILPSGSPYFHTAHKIISGKKYLIKGLFITE